MSPREALGQEVACWWQDRRVPVQVPEDGSFAQCNRQRIKRSKRSCTMQRRKRLVSGKSLLETVRRYELEPLTQDSHDVYA